MRLDVELTILNEEFVHEVQYNVESVYSLAVFVSDNILDCIVPVEILPAEDRSEENNACCIDLDLEWFVEGNIGKWKRDRKEEE